MDFDTPDFPPLLRGEAAEDPFAAAIARAREGTDAGLVTHRIRPDHLSAALVLAPEVPLAGAMAMVPAAANAFADAFGALAPSETALQFDWPGGLRLNGGRCGGFRAAADTRDPQQVPGWLVIGLDLQVFAADDNGATAAEPGATPDRTTLWEEGCAEVTPQRLLESWSRHLLVWINEWEENGPARLHRDWLGRAFALNKQVTTPQPGTFLGLDDNGGMLLKQEGGATLVPLTTMLEQT